MSDPINATGRLTVYLDVDIQDEGGEPLSVDGLTAAMQNLVETPVVNTPDVWAVITGVEVGVCAVSRNEGRRAQ